MAPAIGGNDLHQDHRVHTIGNVVRPHTLNPAGRVGRPVASEETTVEDVPRPLAHQMMIDVAEVQATIMGTMKSTPEPHQGGPGMVAVTADHQYRNVAHMIGPPTVDVQILMKRDGHPPPETVATP